MAYLEYRRGSRVALALLLGRPAVRDLRDRPVPVGLARSCRGRGRRRRPRRSTSVRPAARWRASPPRSACSAARGACARGWCCSASSSSRCCSGDRSPTSSTLLAVLLVLFVDRSLRVQRTTVREQRLIAFVAVLVLGAVEIVTILVPTDGPFGPTEPASGGFVDFAIDVVVILLVANGLRRGRRWAGSGGHPRGRQRADGAARARGAHRRRARRARGTIDGETELALAQRRDVAAAARLPGLGAPRVPRPPQIDPRPAAHADRRRRQARCCAPTAAARCRG